MEKDWKKYNKNRGMVTLFFLVIFQVSNYENIVLSSVGKKKNAIQMFNSGKLLAFLRQFYLSFYTINKNSITGSSHF